MVIHPAQFKNSRRRQRGALMTELMVAIAILLGALIPLAYTVHTEKKQLRAEYTRALAMEIVDGEMETLAAGEWQAFKPGLQTYAIHSPAAANLPAGKFTLFIDAEFIRLEWQPEKTGNGGRVTREVKLTKNR